MFSKVIMKSSTGLANMAFTRNLGSSSVLMNKTDPVQQLFLDKIREYYKKKSASKTGIVDSSPEAQKAVKDEIEKINKQFGTSATAEFPTLNFTEPKLESNPEKLENIKI